MRKMWGREEGRLRPECILDPDHQVTLPTPGHLLHLLFLLPAPKHFLALSFRSTMSGRLLLQGAVILCLVQAAHTGGEWSAEATAYLI